MSEHTADELEREEIEMLLPWYVTGKLDRADMAKVESYLARHPRMAAQLDLIRAERDATVLGNEALSSPSAAARDRLMASLPPARLGIAQRIAGSAQLARIADFFTAPSARGAQWAAIAAGVLIVVQAAAITGLIIRAGGSTYETAAGPSTGVGPLALVVFADEAKAPAIARLLREFNASIVDGPKPGGVYKIRLRTEDRSPAAQEAILQRLAERRDIVRVVVPSKD
ncbi:MAG: hypothetical protein K2X43_22145 [Hyphomonadaceae bacterium]|nr:hypothetical protein [Hyphomonadaceae bacterium]